MPIPLARPRRPTVRPLIDFHLRFDREARALNVPDAVIALPYHCHIIDYEDNEMMRPFAVLP